MDARAGEGHHHVFLGHEHEANTRRTWWVIALCGATMAVEIAGGLAFGSIALVADGLHMSTHAGALLLAALAYAFARRHAADRRFTFGTGKLGDLAGFASAIVLAVIAVLIGCEAAGRVFAPVPIRFSEAIPIACLGLAVNVASVWLLSGGGRHHHGHHHHGDDAGGGAHILPAGTGTVAIGIHEHGVPPRFRARFEGTAKPRALVIETMRPDGAVASFPMTDRGDLFESVDVVPEPHAFRARLRAPGDGDGLRVETDFSEDGHGASATHHDNNMRAAIVHVLADAAVSVLVIAGLIAARAFGWSFMDPLAGLVGAGVIASWSYGLVRDTGAILLDMVPDRATEAGIRAAIEGGGDRLDDLHLWRLGPGHLGAILSVATAQGRSPAYYRERLARFAAISHVTVEVVEA